MITLRGHGLVGSTYNVLKLGKATTLPTFAPDGIWARHRSFRSGPPDFNTTTSIQNPASAGNNSPPVNPATVPPTPASSLSTLPNTVLLRSLFVNSITSRSWLLTPAIAFLSLLCRPHLPAILDANRNPVLRWLIKQTVYKQFCAGENPEEIKKTVKTMKDMGFRGAMLTYARETLFDHKTGTEHDLGGEEGSAVKSDVDPIIEAWRQGTLGTAALLDTGDQLAIKITGAGSRVTNDLAAVVTPPQQFIDALEEAITECKRRGVKVLIDAESQRFQFGIFKVGIDLMRKFNKDGYAVVYNTYQGYLKSTPATIQKHLATASEDNFTLGLKLVRGAYLDTDQRSLIHDTKNDTDNAYNMIAQGALQQKLGDFGEGQAQAFPSVNLLLCTHNKESAFAAHLLHQQRLRDQLPTVPVSFAQLQGMADHISFGLLALRNDGKGNGPDVLKCSTWGGLAECIGYLARRASENRDAASRTTGEYVALKKETWRRIKALW